MKKLFPGLLMLLLTCAAVSQVPQEMNYQAVLRDSFGNIRVSAVVSMRFSIIDSTPASGTVLYAETQTCVSNQFGLITLVVGNGFPVLGNFSTIAWGIHAKYLMVEMDASGGTHYLNVGLSKLLSVPYALYAEKSGSTVSNATTSYVVKFNGIQITDSSINHVCTGGAYTALFSFVTANNYWYNLNRGTDSAINYTTGFLTTDTVSNSVFYTFPAGYGNSGQIDAAQGALATVSTNLTNGVYYVPLNATPVIVSNLWGYDAVGHYYYNNSGATSGPQTVMQLLPNNPAITGFNLSFPVKVTVER